MIVIEMNSTKVKVPTGTKNRTNLIGDPFRSETRFVWLLLATTGRPALSCSLCPTKHVEPDLQISFCRYKGIGIVMQPSLVFPSLPGLCEETLLCSH